MRTAHAMVCGMRFFCIRKEAVRGTGIVLLPRMLLYAKEERG